MCPSCVNNTRPLESRLSSLLHCGGAVIVVHKRTFRRLAILRLAKVQFTGRRHYARFVWNVRNGVGIEKRYVNRGDPPNRHVNPHRFSRVRNRLRRNGNIVTFRTNLPYRPSNGCVSTVCRF